MRRSWNSKLWDMGWGHAACLLHELPFPSGRQMRRITVYLHRRFSVEELTAHILFHAAGCPFQLIGSDTNSKSRCYQPNGCELSTHFFHLTFKINLWMHICMHTSAVCRLCAHGIQPRGRQLHRPYSTRSSRCGNFERSNVVSSSYSCMALLSYRLSQMSALFERLVWWNRPAQQPRFPFGLGHQIEGCVCLVSPLFRCNWGILLALHALERASCMDWRYME